MTFKYPLATSSWDQDEYAAMQRVIASDQFSMAEEVSNYEMKFAAAFGSKHAVMVNSGSSANLLMIAALRYTSNSKLKLNIGDEIIVPAVSWPTTYYPLYQYGLHLKFVDVDLETLNYDISALQRAVSENTRAIMVVNLLGNPNDFDAINTIIGDRNITLLEDNCESMGAKYNGKYTGTFGIMGTFSTFFSHHISTMEGGVILTDDEEVYHILLTLRAHGWTRNLPKINQVSGIKSDDPFLESFKFVLPGYNVRPLEISGAIGSEQLKKFPHLLNGRRANGDLVQKLLSDHPTLMIQKEIGHSSWFGFSLVIRPGVEFSRAKLVKELSSYGFECRPIVTGNFAKNDVVKFFDHSIFETLENAQYIDQNGVFVGNHHYDCSESIELIAKIAC